MDKSSCSFYDPCLTLDGFNVQGSNTTTPLIMNYLRAPPEQLERDCLQYSMVCTVISVPQALMRLFSPSFLVYSLDGYFHILQHGNPNGQPLQPDDVMVCSYVLSDDDVNLCFGIF